MKGLIFIILIVFAFTRTGREFLRWTDKPSPRRRR